MEQPEPKTGNDDPFMWQSTTHLVMGQFPQAPSFDWIAVLLPYQNIPTRFSGYGLCPFPEPAV